MEATRLFKRLITIFSLAALSLCASATYAEDPPAVSPQLRTGCEFNEQSLGEMATQSNWFHIPWWLAGTWKRDHSITYSAGEAPRAKKDERVRIFGFQTDAKGGIWHLVRTPFKVVTRTPGSINYFLIRKEEPIKISKQEVTIRMVWTIWHVHEKTGRILRVNQGDQVDTFRPMNENALDASSVCQAYTETGKPMGVWRARWVDHKMEVYKPTAELNGQNLVVLLSDFLKQNGRYNRIPQGTGQPVTTPGDSNSDLEN